MLEYSKALKEVDIKHGSEKEYLTKQLVELELLIEHYRKEYTRLMLLMERYNADKKEVADHYVSNEEIDKYCKQFEQRCEEKNKLARAKKAIEEIGRAFGISTENAKTAFAQLAGYSAWTKNR